MLFALQPQGGAVAREEDAEVVSRLFLIELKVHFWLFSRHAN